MTKIAALSAIAACLLSSASFAAETGFSSPAFVHQASVSGYSSLDTSAIMKPAFSMISALPAVTAPTAGNLADSLQIGDLNVANIEQTGIGNVALVRQSGNMNTASITQQGGSHQAFIAQQGNNNVAIIHQR